MIIHSPIISGSLMFADGSTVTLPDGSIYSGSFSGSIQIAEVQSHLIPNTNEAYDLGSATLRFRDIYLSNSTIKMPSGSFGFNNGAFAFSDPNGDPAPIKTSIVTFPNADGGVSELKIIEGQLTTQVFDSTGSLSGADLAAQLSGSFTGSFLGEILSTNGVISGSSQISVTSANISDVDAFSQSGTYTNLRAQATTAGDVSLGNVTNESKETMFTSPTFTGTVSGVTATHVSLGNVTNTSDDNKPVSTAQQTALDLKADIASPTFTGVVTITTADSNDNSTKAASTAFVQTEISDLIGGAGAAFDTLLEISASIANGDSDVVALTTTVSSKLQKDQNLSDLTDAGLARTNLGVTIGTHVQAFDAQLTDVAGLTPTDGNFIVGDGTNFVAESGDTARTSLGLGNVENTALSTYTGIGGALDNQYITNGKGYITSFDITDQTDGKYLRSDEDDTADGIITISNTTDSTTITTGALIVTGGVGISGALNVGGDVVAYASSDKRLKDNIQNIQNPIQKVQQLNGVTWDWNSNADELQQTLPNVGVIAQEVEVVFPQLVHDRENGYKGVDYAKLTGLLIEAVKEQQKQIEELKSKLG